MAACHRFVAVLWGACAAGCDDWYSNGLGYCARQLEVVSHLGTVAVHACEQNLARASLLAFDRPLHGIHAGGCSSAMDEDLPFRRGFFIISSPFGIDRYDNTLISELFGRLRNDLRSLDRRRVDCYFVCACAQDLSEIFDGPNTASNRERDEDLFCDARRDLDNQIALFVTGSDIEENELVRAHCIIPLGELCGVPRITKIEEIHSLDYTPAFNIEARYNSTR